MKMDVDTTEFQLTTEASDQRTTDVIRQST